MPPPRKGQRSSAFPNVNRSDFFDDDLEEETGPKPGVPEDESNPLWSIYGIHPGLPFRIIVEKLILLWDLSVSEIISVTKEEASRVQHTVDDLNRGWVSLGEGLTEDEKVLARGKMIKELLGLKAELEKIQNTQDSKVINMKINLAEKIAKLRGVETEKKPVVDETQDELDPIHSAIGKLNPEERRRLHDSLNKSK